MIRGDKFDGVLTEALAAPMVDSPGRSERLDKGMEGNVAWWKGLSGREVETNGCDGMLTI